MKYYLAIDIGASSGRHIVGYRDENGLLQMEETYRFPNTVIEKDGHLIWDIDALFLEVKNGIRESLKRFPKIESLAIDTWGVDYVLLKEGKPLYPVYAYRDSRTEKSIPEVHKIIPFEELYRETGIQFEPFNTIYQLYEDKMSGRLSQADSFLYIPQYLSYRLTGVASHELTEASTSSLLNVNTHEYSPLLIEKLDFPKAMFPRLSKPGTVLGRLLPEVEKEVGGNLTVRLCPSHDTASAVEGLEVPEGALYLSSGTWSLLGIKSKEPIVSGAGQAANYSNELGPDYVRYLKNIMGLWIIQRLQKEMGYSFSEMVELAKKSDYEETFDVNDDRFLSALEMKKAIDSYFTELGIPLPGNDGDYINATYLSLAVSYKKAIQQLEKISGHEYETLVIGGGGAKNEYLNRLTEEMTGKKVIAKPIEITAKGNLESQMEE